MYSNYFNHFKKIPEPYSSKMNSKVFNIESKITNFENHESEKKRFVCDLRCLYTCAKIITVYLKIILTFGLKRLKLK